MRPAPDERTPEELLAFGVVNVDKPPGPSAHEVSAWARDAAGVEKAAHAGTLDPKVTGCLPVLLGVATRLAPVMLEGTKEYVAVLELHGDPPRDLRDVIGEFEAPLYQKPPRKSAVSRRLRVREIHALDVLEISERKVLLRIECESGTYIRKLCHDLGLALGTGGHMGHLRRTKTGPFDEYGTRSVPETASGDVNETRSVSFAHQNAPRSGDGNESLRDSFARQKSEISGDGNEPRARGLHTMYEFVDALAEYRERGDESWLRESVLPGEAALVDLPSVTVAPSAAEQIAEGAPVYAPGVVESDDATRGALVACYTPNGSAVCLGRIVGDLDADEGEVVSLERVLV